MSRNTRRSLAISAMSLVLLTLPAGAKPPGLPDGPETEFRVLSPLAQEFNQPDEPKVSALAPITTDLPEFPVVGALVGAWTQVCDWSSGTEILNIMPRQVK